MHNFSIKSLAISFSLLIGIFTIFILSTVGFLFHLKINIFYPLISLLVSLVSIFAIEKHYNLALKDIMFSYLIFFIAIIISLFFGYHTVDYSGDGAVYHQETIILLKQGYNPVYDNVSKFAESFFKTHTFGTIWTENYQKFAEIVQANIFALTNNIESSKMLNLICAFALFCYSFYVLSAGFLKNASRNIYAGIISFLIVFNPVIMAQIMTFYIDGFVYIFFMFILLGIISIETNKETNKLSWIIILLSAVCLINIKFGGILYLVASMTVYAIYLLFKKSKDKIKTLGVVFIITILLGLISGINPYFTNVWQGRNPFYPLAGKDKIDIITANTPHSFYNKCPMYKFLASTFSRADNLIMSSDKRHQLKIPFSMYKSEFGILRATDTRVCGFGVLWSGIILLALFLAMGIKTDKEKLSLTAFIKINFENKEDRNIAFLTFSILFVLLFLNPYAWWARYCPHLWAIPIFVMLYRIKEKHLNKPDLICVYFLIFVMIANSGIQTFNSWKAEHKHKIRIKRICNNIKNSPQKLLVYGMFDVAIYEKLREKNIYYETVSKEYFEEHKNSFTEPKHLGVGYWNYEEITNDK